MHVNCIARDLWSKKYGQGSTLVQKLENSSTARRLVLRITETYIDLSNSSQFRLALEKHRTAKVKNYILDMEDVQYFDSTGLGALTTFFHEIDGKNQGLILINVGESLHEIMRVTKIDNIIPIFNDLEDALGSLEPS